MAEPLPPVGFIRLRDAFDTYVFVMLGKAPSPQVGEGGAFEGYQKGEGFAARQGKLSDEFIRELTRTSFRGRILAANNSEHSLTTDCIERAKFPTLLLLHNAIPLGMNGPLDNYVGGLICLDGKVFFDWLRVESSIFLHGEIQEGRLTPIEADERLAKIGLPALHPEPDPKEFHSAAMAHASWTIPMVVSWIAWRDLDYVVHCLDNYRNKLGHWRESKGANQINLGMAWESASPVTQLSLALSEALTTTNGKSQFNTIKESKQTLWNALEEMKLEATGKLGHSQRQPIAGHLWQDLEIASEGNNREYLYPRGNFNKNYQWNEVTINREALLKLWPVNPADVQLAERTAVRTESTPSKKPKLETAKLAISTLWPNGVPSTKTAKMRNSEIQKWCKSNAKECPSERIIRYALSNS